MKSFLLPSLLITSFLLSACIFVRKPHKTQQKYLPKTHNSLYLGMPQQQVLQLFPNAQSTNNHLDFREAYLEEMPDNSPLDNVLYYFDAEGEKILYELIFSYKSESVRDDEALNLFGKPNHEGEKWLVDSGEGFMINAWTFDKKMVVAGKIKGTEWESE